MKLRIEEIEQVQIRGVRVAKPGTGTVLRRGNFEWVCFPLETQLKTSKVVSGLLQGWHHEVYFDQVEYHEDTENFYFLEGTVLMLFCDQQMERPDMSTLRLVRIRPGTQIEVEAGKCHYVPIPETDIFKAYVFTPIQPSVMLKLSEPITLEYD